MAGATALTAAMANPPSSGLARSTFRHDGERADRVDDGDIVPDLRLSRRAGGIFFDRWGGDRHSVYPSEPALDHCPAVQRHRRGAVDGGAVFSAGRGIDDLG